MRISDWSSDVCSSDLSAPGADGFGDESDGGDQQFAQTDFVRRAVEATGDFASRRGFLVKVEALLEQANVALRPARSAERRVGHECVSTCRSRGSTYHKKKNPKKKPLLTTLH